MGKKAKRGKKLKNPTTHAVLRANNIQPEKGQLLGKTKAPEEKPIQKWETPKKMLYGAYACIVFLVGFFGYSSLWPKITIDPSAAVDDGIFSYQFSVVNQCCYPLKIRSSMVSVVEIGAPFQAQSQFHASDVGFVKYYKDTSIPGGESTVLSFDSLKILNMGKIDIGSKIIVRINYSAFGFLNELTTGSLFEAARDNAGNEIWIKRSIGKYKDYKPSSIIASGPKDN